MTNATDCAFPADSKVQTDGGLSKREYFAALALQGCIAMQSHPESGGHGMAEDVAVRAVQYADALIVELNKKKNEETKTENL